VTPEERDDVPAEDDNLDEPGTESQPSVSTATGSSRTAGPGHKKPKRDKESDGDKPKRKQLPVWQETILLLGIALVLAVIIKALFVQAFYIPSQSMEPGLVKNDRILVQKVSYWGSGSPRRGDVIVFKDPGGWLSPADNKGPTSLLARGLAKVGLYPTGGHLVKRVIGVAGDVVTCCDEQGRLSVNGYALDESDYVAQDGTECAAPSATPRCKLDVGPIPQGYLLVMGDNRSNSSDSTAHLCSDAAQDCPATRGLIPVNYVVGKVFALVWPRDHFRRITRPAIFEDIPDSP
jgi:signal peptidase I